MKSRLKILASIVVGIGLIVLWLRIVDFGTTVGLLKGLRLSLLIPLVLVFLAGNILRSLRFKIVLSPMQPISAAESFHLCMTNQLVNFLVPLHAGEVAKCALLKETKGAPLSRTLLASYLDKAAELLPIFLVVVAAPFLEKRIGSVVYLVCGIVAAILGAVTLVLAFFIHRPERAPELAEKLFFFFPGAIREKARRLAALFAGGLSSLPRLRRRIPEILALTALSFALQALFTWLFFDAFGLRLPLLTAIIASALLNSSFLLPAPPGFSGSLELAFVFIFSYLYGYDKNLTSAVAASTHVFVGMMIGLLGFIALGVLGKRLSAVFNMRADENAYGKSQTAGLEPGRPPSFTADPNG
jgi:uncharacterized protein (TIRG00374 family)